METYLAVCFIHFEIRDGALLLKYDQKVVYEKECFFHVSWVCDWIETTAITYLSILIYNGASYESITGWYFMGEITGKGGLNQLFRLKWKVQRSHIAACSKLGKLGQFHNILLGSKLCSCCTEGEAWKQRCLPWSGLMKIHCSAIKII